VQGVATPGFSKSEKLSHLETRSADFAFRLAKIPTRDIDLPKDSFGKRISLLFLGIWGQHVQKYVRRPPLSMGSGENAHLSPKAYVFMLF